MHSYTLRSVLFMLILLLSSACTGENPDSLPAEEAESVIPEAVRGMENVAVYSLDDFPDPDSVVLEEDLVITMTDYLYIDGFPSDIIVDDSSRIYVDAGAPGNAGIHIFDEDGNYLRKILKTGRGPGEVEAVASMAYRNDHLYLLDARLQKVVSYSTNTFEAGKDRVLEKDPTSKNSEILAGLGANEIYLSNQGDPVLQYRSRQYSDTTSYNYFYRMNDDGVLDSTFNFKAERIHYYPYEMKLTGGNRESILWPMPMPFGSRTIVRQAEDGDYYVNWTEELLIRIYDNDWNYLRSIYYDMPKYEIDLAELDIPDERKEATEGEPVPEYWPVVQNFQVDDEKRLWISTFTESDSLYKWLVLAPDGDLLGSFIQEGDRSDNTFVSPLPRIKNGYYYDKSINTDTWVSKVFRKKIRFGSE